MAGDLGAEWRAHDEAGVGLWDPRFTLGALPLALFINGHGYFVARADRVPRAPIAVHATYSLDNHDGLAKQQRFREAGLWRVDPPSYFEGKFLAYNATPSAALREAAPSFKSRGKSRRTTSRRTRWRWRATSPSCATRSRSRARSGARSCCRGGRATATGCGRGSDDIFHFGCMYPGAQDGNFLPFDCPMDHVLSPTAWKGSGVPRRRLRRRAAARPRAPPPPRCACCRAPSTTRCRRTPAAALPLGVSDSDAVARLSPLQNAPVIRLESALGLLCGVDDAAARRELRRGGAAAGVPAWGAKCFQPCKSELKEWLSDDEIARGARAPTSSPSASRSRRRSTRAED